MQYGNSGDMIILQKKIMQHFYNYTAVSGVMFCFCLCFYFMYNFLNYWLINEKYSQVIHIDAIGLNNLLLTVYFWLRAEDAEEKIRHYTELFDWLLNNLK